MAGVLLLAGALQLAASWALPGTSVGASGARGTPALSVAEADHAPAPSALRARTCTSYAVPFVSPPTVREVAVEFSSISTVMRVAFDSPAPSAATQKCVPLARGPAVHASPVYAPVPLWESVTLQICVPWVFMLLVVGAAAAWPARYAGLGLSELAPSTRTRSPFTAEPSR